MTERIFFEVRFGRWFRFKMAARWVLLAAWNNLLARPASNAWARLRGSAWRRNKQPWLPTFPVGRPGTSYSGPLIDVRFVSKADPSMVTLGFYTGDGNGK